MLKPGGLFVFTCASTGRKEHGTARTSPNDSYGTISKLVDMVDYYKNLTEIDVNKVLEFHKTFSVWDTYYNFNSKDLYFVGIKNGSDNITQLKEYIKGYVINTSLNIINL